MRYQGRDEAVMPDEGLGPVAWSTVMIGPFVSQLRALTWCLIGSLALSTRVKPRKSRQIVANETAALRNRQDLLRFGSLHSHRRALSHTNLPRGDRPHRKCLAPGALRLPDRTFAGLGGCSRRPAAFIGTRTTELIAA